MIGAERNVGKMEMIRGGFRGKGGRIWGGGGRDCVKSLQKCHGSLQNGFYMYKIGREVVELLAQCFCYVK